MIVHPDIKQGSREWLTLRAGIPTASSFHKIITPGGKPSESAEPYMHTLLAERCMGHPIKEHVTMFMERGSLMEIDAVKFYEFRADVSTIPIGFITNDERTIGASPDRLVGDDGLLEIKVPSEGVHVSYLLASGGAYKAYKVQVQGQLWVSERKFVDVLSWHPELPEALVRIERDEEYIEKLAACVTAFSKTLEDLTQVARERGWMDRPKKFLSQDDVRAMNNMPPLPPLDDLVRQAQEAGHRP